MAPSFEDYPQPEWNTPTSVSDAMTAIASARTQKQSAQAYDQLLYALGNNHAGTYYPIALAALPRLALVLRSGHVWAQHAALNVLIELTGSFVPDAEHEHFAGSALAESIHSDIGNMRSIIEQVAQAGTEASTSAIELLEQI